MLAVSSRSIQPECHLSISPFYNLMNGNDPLVIAKLSVPQDAQGLNSCMGGLRQVSMNSALSRLKNFQSIRRARASRSTPLDPTIAR